MKVRLCLDRYLNAHSITRYELAKRMGIGFPILDHYYKNQAVRYDSYILGKICTALSCETQDIIERIP